MEQFHSPLPIEPKQIIEPPPVRKLEYVDPNDSEHLLETAKPLARAARIQKKITDARGVVDKVLGAIRLGQVSTSPHDDIETAFLLILEDVLTEDASEEDIHAAIISRAEARKKNGPLPRKEK